MLCTHGYAAYKLGHGDNNQHQVRALPPQLSTGPHCAGSTHSTSPLWQWFPRIVRPLCHVRITAVAGGKEHTMLVSESGSLYAVGDNAWGQLGTGNMRVIPRCMQPQTIQSQPRPPVPHTPVKHGCSVQAYRKPVKLSLPGGARVTQVACGGFHTIALGTSGALYCWCVHPPTCSVRNRHAVWLTI